MKTKPKKSSVTAAQYLLLTKLLRAGKKNTYELRRNGIMAPAARIKEMNDRLGFQIPTVDRIAIFDEEGYPHFGVAVYQLVKEPEARNG